VQGDERDEIYFSITYGPEATGRTLMRFGPLNHEGGERRLNVAVTRARRAMHVFASLRPEQIDLSRARARGARDLRRFLEYAERGPAALATPEGAARPDAAPCPSEAAVARALRRLGWETRGDIGHSACRIGVGVVSPNRPGVYLAGLEGDGAAYRDAATARDRDLARGETLGRLGWRIIRLWSVDWWLDPEGALARLDEDLRAIRRETGP